MIKKIYQECNKSKTLPIDLVDIVSFIKLNGVTDTIVFYEVDIDPNVVRGFIRQYDYSPAPYAAPESIAEIYYPKGQGDHWSSLVKCKELLHLFDSDGSVAGDRASVEALITQIVIPSELAHQTQPTAADTSAIVLALAILFPKNLRDQFLEPYNAGKISALEIAKIAEIPHRFVAWLMSPHYDRFVERCLGD
jgi:hypothetical protein